MKPIVVLGAGGHAKVVAETAGLLGYDVRAFVDEGGTRVGIDVHGIPVVANLEAAPEYPVAFGIGDNAARLGRYGALIASGRSVVTLVHPNAVVSRTVEIGPGTLILAGVVVNSDVNIGAAVVLNTSCSADHDCRIGDGAHLAPGSRLAGGVTVGIGAFVGMGTMVLPSRTIGAWAVCGAGSVVVEDVQPDRTVKGVPAR